MDKKEIKKFYLSLIDNPDATWNKTTYNDWILLNCRINNICVDSEIGYRLTFRYLDNNGYTIESQSLSLKEIGISRFRMVFPYFGIAYRVLRRIKREETYGKPEQLKVKLDKVSMILSKDKALNRDNKINQILN